ncbi:hypothetical protein ZIOFF_024440 [Zingiber officinale]|uniref:poly(A)-specific ribonuclease n=1 Tax=Zingiber officinale TaxID=94328 RepID=A0A8J5HC61_ZINOF|nr:hypothetical protein ZIOFF_024440 [Zingiber officinale]
MEIDQGFHHDIWMSNMVENSLVIDDLLHYFPIVTIDTEFPDFLRNTPSHASDEQRMSTSSTMSTEPTSSNSASPVMARLLTWLKFMDRSIKPSTMDVWMNNVVENSLVIEDLLRYFPIVAIDTEFPGFLRDTPRHASNEQRYADVKHNVDGTSIIQFGLAMFDASGNQPWPGCCWQFNFADFDPDLSASSPNSIRLLQESSHDLHKNCRNGSYAGFEAIRQTLRAIINGLRTQFQPQHLPLCLQVYVSQFQSLFEEPAAADSPFMCQHHLPPRKSHPMVVTSSASSTSHIPASVDSTKHYLHPALPPPDQIAAGIYLHWEVMDTSRSFANRGNHTSRVVTALVAASLLLAIASPLLAIASPLLAIASPLLAIASPLLAIASPLLAVTSPLIC